MRVIRSLATAAKITARERRYNPASHPIFSVIFGVFGITESILVGDFNPFEKY